MLKRCVAVACLLVCIGLVVFSREAMESARNGLDIWWHIALPALFPFFVSVSLMQKTGVLTVLFETKKKGKRRIPAAAVPIMALSFISGAPFGARMCSTALGDGSLTKKEAQRFSAIFNLASPMFIFGAIATGMLGEARAGLPIFIGQFLSALIMAFGLSFFDEPPCKKTERTQSNVSGEKFNVFKSLVQSITDGFTSMFKIGGCIVFFVVMIGLIEACGLIDAAVAPFNPILSSLGIDPMLAKATLIGNIEMVNGCNMIASLNAPLAWRASLCAAAATSGGLCIMVQSMAFLNISPIKYLALKQAQSILSGLITFAIFPFMVPYASAVGAIIDANLIQYNITTGLFMLVASLSALIIMAIFHQVAKRIRKKSVIV